MKLRLFWFLLGAGLASGIAALLVSQLGDRVPAPGATGSALDDRLASIDRRLAATYAMKLRVVMKKLGGYGT